MVENPVERGGKNAGEKIANGDGKLTHTHTHTHTPTHYNKVLPVGTYNNITITRVAAVYADAYIAIRL